MEFPLRFESLYSMLDARYKRVSFSGLINDYPVPNAFLKYFFHEIEAYEELGIMENYREQIDSEFAIFIKPDSQVIIFKKQPVYYKIEYNEIINKTDIKQSEIQEVIEATK